MNPLVLFDSLDLSKSSNENFYTTTEIIATQSGNSYKVESDLVRKYRSELEKIAHLNSFFKKLNVNDAGRSRKVYKLNEQQTLFFIPLLGNTPAVVQFKFDLAAAFVAMRNELQARKIERATEKATTRSLTDAVQNWKHTNNYAQSNFRKLLIKCATGLPYTKVQARGDKGVPMVDLLTAEELERYNKLKALVIPLLDFGETYKDIKEYVEKIATKKLSESLATKDSF
ncbi:Rha family transcriptional regulator [Lactococcus kimchii]|uniref:hypothetical protein n=1 Tax=Lactococcus sp. S-13 TaxID=2507158 RepID=UPI001CC1D638|nr:hypothetical protein [Lactococcus sp. S-13]